MLLAESDGAGIVQKEYIWLDGMPLAQVFSGALYFVHADQLGTAQAITDGSQAIVWDAAYVPFGETASLSGAYANNLRFPGQYFDAETATNYNYFRTYDPSIGRYVQSDPIGLLGGLNTYAYVAGNPLSLTDPTGQVAPMFVAAGIGALVGGGLDFVIQLVENGGKMQCVDFSRVALAALEGAVLSGLGPEGFLLGRGGARAAAGGFNQNAGLLNRGARRFGWSFNGNSGRNVLSYRDGASHFDIPGTGVSPYANPVRSGLPAGLGAAGFSALNNECVCEK
jgi:RHS repeat-associated protein